MVLCLDFDDLRGHTREGDSKWARENAPFPAIYSGELTKMINREWVIYRDVRSL